MKKKHAGANYKKGDGFAFVFPEMSKKSKDLVLTYIECYFDTACDADEIEARLDQRLHRHAIKTSIIKMILFIPEFFLTLIFHGVADAYAKSELMLLHFNFLCGRISERDINDGASVLSLELIERLKR
jgi:hypothetical protein